MAFMSMKTSPVRSLLFSFSSVVLLLCDILRAHAKKTNLKLTRTGRNFEVLCGLLWVQLRPAVPGSRASRRALPAALVRAMC